MLALMNMTYLSKNGTGCEERKDDEVPGDITMDQVQLCLEEIVHMVQNFGQHFLQRGILTAVVNLLTNLLQKFHSLPRSWKNNWRRLTHDGLSRLAAGSDKTSHSQRLLNISLLGPFSQHSQRASSVRDSWFLSLSPCAMLLGDVKMKW